MIVWRSLWQSIVTCSFPWGMSGWVILRGRFGWVRDREGADAIRLVLIFCHYTCGLSWFLYKKTSTESFAKWKGEPRTFKSKKHPNRNHWKFPIARIYKYNVTPTPFPLILSNKRKTPTFFLIFFWKHLDGMRKNHTFASAFENERCYKTVIKSERADKRKSSLKRLQ